MNLETLHKISYGLFIVASKRGERINGQIANTVFQVSADPPTIAVSINKLNLTHEYIQDSRVFTVSILSKEAPLKFIGQFGFKSGKEIDKFADVNYKIGTLGVPIVLDYSIGYLEAEVTGSIDVKTHTVFIGRITMCDKLGDAEPMTYNYYHEVKRGTSPKTAPTYIKKEEPVSAEAKMDKYKCSVCGYIYNPLKGDPEKGILPNSPFDELPETWVCPICGATKDMFEKEE